MFIRIEINQRMDIYSTKDKPDDLSYDFNPITDFVRGVNSVSVRTIGKVEKIEDKEGKQQIKSRREIKTFVITIALKKEPAKIDESMLPEWGKIISVVLKRITRILKACGVTRSFHNFVLDLDKKNSKRQLINWKLKISKDGINFADFPFKKSDLEETLLNIYLHNSGKLFQYPVVIDGALTIAREMLEDNIEIPPEEELSAQAREFLNEKKYRHALLEAVAGLEVITARYMRLSLKRKGISNTSINDFICPQVDLSKRIKVIIPILMSTKSFEKIDTSLVSTAISARNDVMHDGLIEVLDRFNNLDLAIKEILSLSKIISNATEQLEYSDDVKAIQSALDKYNRHPLIWIYKNHNVIINVTLYSTDYKKGKLNKEEIEKIMTIISNIREEQDERFEPNNHLSAYFTDLLTGKIVAFYRKGELVSIS